MVEWTHDWFNHIPEVVLWFWTVIGGGAGARLIVRWVVRKYSDYQAEKKRQRDEIARQAGIEASKKSAEHSELLETLKKIALDVRNENESLRRRNDELAKDKDDLYQMVFDLQKAVNDVKHDVGEVQLVAGTNQEKIQKVQNESKAVSSAAQVLKKMTDSSTGD